MEYGWAKDAAKAKNWPKVLEHINIALKEKPTPQKDAKTYGMNFVDYFPCYYRGLALFNLSRYKEAQKALNKCLEYGAVKDADDAADLLPKIRGMIESCKQKTAPPPPKPEPVQKPRVKKDSETEQVIRQHINSGNNHLIAGNLTAAKKDFNTAKGLIETSGKHPDLKTEVLSKLDTVTKKETAAKLLEEADQFIRRKRYKRAENILLQVIAVDPGNKLAQQSLRIVASELEKAKEPAQTKPEPAALPKSPGTKSGDDNTNQSVEKLLRAGEQLFAEGNYPNAREKFSGILQLQPNHKGARQWLVSIDYASGVRVLNEGIKRYFHSDLPGSERSCREAIRRLSQITANQLPELSETVKQKRSEALVRAYQFLAVVLIEKYHLGIDTTGQGLEEARQFIDRIYRISPGFTLDADYFPPKVIKYFTPGEGKKD